MFCKNFRIFNMILLISKSFFKPYFIQHLSVHIHPPKLYHHVRFFMLILQISMRICKSLEEFGRLFKNLQEFARICKNLKESQEFTRILQTLPGFLKCFTMRLDKAWVNGSKTRGLLCMQLVLFRI